MPHGTIHSMIRKLFLALLLVVLVGVADSASAQLLSDTTDDTTTITVGTTTYDVRFPQATLGSARERLQSILYYLRNFDTPAVTNTLKTGTSTTVVVPSTYSSITEYAFESDVVQTPENSFAGIEALTQEGVKKTTAGTKTCYTFTKDFTINARGAEVIELQRFLNRFADTRVAQSGAGSPGNETDYFGTKTFSAVIAFQAKHSGIILAPLGLTSPTGYWGAATRAQANKLFGCGA